MSFFSNIVNKIKTKLSSSARLIDDAYLEELEAQLIRCDLGVKLAFDFADSLRKNPCGEQQVQERLKEFLLNAFGKHDSDLFKLKASKNQLNILLVVGVNGVGKTTSIGKLAHRFKKQGYKTLIAAGDTFRAAAEEQLNHWAQRAQVDILQLEEGAKASAVVYKAIEKAQTENYNMLIIDTAGRLQNKANLMEELTKLKQVIDKNTDPNTLVETMLVLDSTTGSNAVLQAENFMEATELNSIILTKFDGSARAGVVFSIAYNFKLAVKFIGTGERLEDIEEFDLNQFISKYF
ncbi:MAG: signal recognition particle-docking protein FtsY [Candidatus Melainabacteria bacterium]|nr:signal recognition particle-docking protein FtsY [Candidatus Melainabacteria bacterium]